MPKQQCRTQSRRAASKEALKQMHILLGDEGQLEISSEDDVIEVEVQPPKKKYKLSHRKSSDGNDRDVIVLKTVPTDDTVFDMQVFVEELNPVQRTRKEQSKKEEKEIEAKLEQLVKAPNSEVIYSGIYATALAINEHLQSAIIGGSQIQNTIALQQPVQSGNAIPQSYQLVMDPRLGVIVGTVAAATTTNSSIPPLQLYPTTKVTLPTTATITTVPEPPTVKTRRGTILRQVPQSAVPGLQKAATAIHPQKPPPLVKTTAPKPVQVKAAPPKTTIKTIPAKPIMPAKGRPTTTVSNSNFRPSEGNVEGGLNMGGTPTKSIDLTTDDGRAPPDSREVSFNKLQGRTYPSLVVVARPHLRVRDLSTDRAKLDAKVKSVLMYPPTKFTEWLIQQGLVRSDQRCVIHANNALKLGMYSDSSKFPYSGGYVWISECCPQRFVSVFSGSLFEGSQHPPISILKLIYHWCCQTIVQNVTQWVKVDNLYVKGMYTWLRAICTVALHTHVKQLGGPGVKVQVGVISLGTTSQDGNKREVKVEVLGILETATRHIRLRAVEPLLDGERNYKKRFNKILEPVFCWVHPLSIIVTDLTVDKTTLHQMGFPHVTQSTSNDYANSNRTIMEYLRRIVPRMFQNTLSLLSRQIIQQFLDELVWREWYGTTVLQCFDNIVQHLSEQTRYEAGQSLIVRLNKVSVNPFKHWSIRLNSPNHYSVQKIADQPLPKRYNRVRKPLPAQPPVSTSQEMVRPTKSTSPDVPEQMVPLENYYYGTINPSNHVKTQITLNIKCPFCKLTFNTNISLMNHLFKHAHNVSNDVQLCRYCLTIVPTSNDLLKHIGTAHPDETKFDNSFVCLICESNFRNPFILGKHMSRDHCPSELPYMCGTCNFRCSNHKQAVDHFYIQHDCGTTIQCPFCLKSTTIYSSGRNITQNMNYFIQHLQKHQKKQLAKRCGRCILWFIQKDFLKDHQTKMHASQRGKQGLVPCFVPRNGIMVPKSKMDKCPDDAKVINFSTLHFNVNKNLNCKECSKPLNSPKHFSSFANCPNPNCQYSTCCATSMQEHVNKCKSLNAALPTEKLPYKMFCICGYSSIYGNVMAKHLAICERKSAYPSVESAKGATVTHSMLDVLGLVRKPEERPSTSSKPPTKSNELLFLSGSVHAPKPRGRPRKIVKEPGLPKIIKKDITSLLVKLEKEDAVDKESTIPKESNMSIDKTDESKDGESGHEEIGKDNEENKEEIDGEESEKSECEISKENQTELIEETVQSKVDEKNCDKAVEGEEDSQEKTDKEEGDAIIKDNVSSETDAVADTTEDSKAQSDAEDGMVRQEVDEAVVSSEEREVDPKSAEESEKLEKEPDAIEQPETESEPMETSSTEIEEEAEGSEILPSEEPEKDSTETSTNNEPIKESELFEKQEAEEDPPEAQPKSSESPEVPKSDSEQISTECNLIEQSDDLAELLQSNKDFLETMEVDEHSVEKESSIQTQSAKPIDNSPKVDDEIAAKDDICPMDTD